MTSPVICDAEYMREFLKSLGHKFPPPFSYVDKYTLAGLDVYEKWLDEQKEFVKNKRFFRELHMKTYPFVKDEDDGKDDIAF